VGGTVEVLCRGGFCFDVLVGGRGGVVGPKELMGGLAPSQTPLPPRFPRLKLFWDKSEPVQFYVSSATEVVPEAHRRHWQFLKKTFG
jgi:hypothetical protein